MASRPPLSSSWTWARQPGHVLVVGEQLGGVAAEHAGAARLEADHEAAVPDVLGQGVHGRLEYLLAGGELAGGDPGQAAAQRLPG
jgi:hypothetical protein